MTNVLVVHGPNLNLLGVREPEIYGSTTLDELDQALRETGTRLGLEVETFQSNHEGAIIERLHDARAVCDAVVLNPAGLTHTSVALRDAVALLEIPVIEVHLTHPMAREDFRSRDLIAPVCTGVISGFGPDSYLAALHVLGRRLAGPA